MWLNIDNQPIEFDNNGYGIHHQLPKGEADLLDFIVTRNVVVKLLSEEDPTLFCDWAILNSDKKHFDAKKWVTKLDKHQLIAKTCLPDIGPVAVFLPL